MHWSSVVEGEERWRGVETMKREDSGHRHTHERVSMEALRRDFAKALIPNSPQVKSIQGIPFPANSTSYAFFVI